MIVFLICLPCCLYHKCGIDWETEFHDRYILNSTRSDGYIFIGGAHITGKCMYMTFVIIGIMFGLLTFIGIILMLVC